MINSCNGCKTTKNLKEYFDLAGDPIDFDVVFCKSCSREWGLE